METLTISLPLELKQFLDEKIAQGEFISYSDYVQYKLAQDTVAKSIDKPTENIGFDLELVKKISADLNSIF